MTSLASVGVLLTSAVTTNKGRDAIGAATANHVDTGHASHYRKPKLYQNLTGVLFIGSVTVNVQ